MVEPVLDVEESPGEELERGEPFDSAGAFFALDERSTRGFIRHGSFIESHRRDGVYESLESERDRDKQKLDHRWLFADLPSDVPLVLEIVGRYEVASADEIATAELSFSPYGQGKTELPGIRSPEGGYRHTAIIDEVGSNSLELRIKLDLARYESWIFEIDCLAISEVHSETPVCQ